MFLVDEGQSVRPIDIPSQVLGALRARAVETKRHYPLSSQMRVLAEGDYLGYVRDVLSDEPPSDARTFATYDLRFFESASAMRDEIVRRDEEHGLSRLVAGYAWEWRTRKDHSPGAYDIELDGMRLCWNRSDIDWINSAGSLDEVGSIHTVQGYDLNYVGVIIGPELYYDATTRSVAIDRAHYFDRRGKSNLTMRGITVTDDDVLAMVRNVYAVLMSRGMRGTYVYVCDPALREHLRPYFTARSRVPARRQIGGNEHEHG
ncbi:hypothetical protein GCM10025865_30130 [Paraoerskovia sediminicola]|uniref:Schlafen group 3-like DNA/RNA helicase domain-containing protein n=1 Tax=Paraoerskovia sediminicola TaxID=1138587 RepID=A0ABM8G6G2_9CELL|nr:hypothetical protein GCM10025865_30130 [Paraoerskovia sediminicola]